MPKTIKKLGSYLGGDSPGMNAAIRSVVRTCAYHNIECIGFIEVIRDDRRGF
jgi:6-phosphofructokinase 1